MSSKGRSADGYVADPKGFFETQSQVTRAVMPFMGIAPGARILQPGCGNGAIAKVLRREWGEQIHIIGVEIDKGRAKQAKKATVIHQATVSGSKARIPVFDEVVVQDFLTYDAGKNSFDIAIENPSFSIWLPVTERCFTMAQQTFMLIPWNSCASAGRVLWWNMHKAHNRVLSPRPSFAKSVKCIYTNGKRAKTDGQPLCSFQELIALTDKPKDTCPLCGSGTSLVTTDSNEYMWSHWAPHITENRWDPLPMPGPHPDDA